MEGGAPRLGGGEGAPLDLAQQQALYLQQTMDAQAAGQMQPSDVLALQQQYSQLQEQQVGGICRARGWYTMMEGNCHERYITGSKTILWW